jgi:single-stranded DNA-binding protein
MNSFRLTAVGQLARNPELSIKEEIILARFCLVGTDEIAESERDGSKEVVTSLWFLAFGEIASMIARNSRKGDQLILEARIVANHWTDRQGNKQHGHTFIVTGFRFGARRGEDGSPIAARPTPPDKPDTDAAQAAKEVTA